MSRGSDCQLLLSPRPSAKSGAVFVDFHLAVWSIQLRRLERPREGFAFVLDFRLTFGEEVPLNKLYKAGELLCL